MVPTCSCGAASGSPHAAATASHRAVCHTDGPTVSSTPRPRSHCGSRGREGSGGSAPGPTHRRHGAGEKGGLLRPGTARKQVREPLSHSCVAATPAVLRDLEEAPGGAGRHREASNAHHSSPAADFTNSRTSCMERGDAAALALCCVAASSPAIASGDSPRSRARDWTSSQSCPEIRRNISKSMHAARRIPMCTRWRTIGAGEGGKEEGAPHPGHSAIRRRPELAEEVEIVLSCDIDAQTPRIRGGSRTCPERRNVRARASSWLWSATVYSSRTASMVGLTTPVRAPRATGASSRIPCGRKHGTHSERWQGCAPPPSRSYGNSLFQCEGSRQAAYVTGLAVSPAPRELYNAAGNGSGLDSEHVESGADFASHIRHWPHQEMCVRGVPPALRVVTTRGLLSSYSRPRDKAIASPTARESVWVGPTARQAQVRRRASVHDAADNGNPLTTLATPFCSPFLRFQAADLQR